MRMIKTVCTSQVLLKMRTFLLSVTRPWSESTKKTKSSSDSSSRKSEGSKSLPQWSVEPNSQKKSADARKKRKLPSWLVDRPMKKRHYSSASSSKKKRRG